MHPEVAKPDSVQSEGRSEHYEEEGCESLY